MKVCHKDLYICQTLTASTKVTVKDFQILSKALQNMKVQTSKHKLQKQKVEKIYNSNTSLLTLKFY